jgi:GT2 family glycosyltransferase
MVSIIIPVFNQHEMTEECITAVREHTHNYELVIVDNGSTPPIHPPFSGFIETTLIRNEENLGFPKAVNQGIRAAKGDVIILLNNDVIVTPGWAISLSSWLEDFAIVGPVTNYCAGLQKVMLPPYECREELDKEAAFLAKDNEGMGQEVNWVIGFCMAFRKTLFDEIGPFDDSIWPCSGEEVDFCLRAKQAGHKTGIAQDVYVHHEGSVTFEAMDAEHSYKEIVEKCDAHLIEKWGPDVYVQEVGRIAPVIIAGESIRLNLGCGYDHRDGYVNIDNRADVKPDLICDVLSGLPYDDNSVDEIRAYDFLEHIPIGETINVITEIWRVLKPGGLFESFTPSTDGRGAFQDPTHVSFWNRNSWLYYSDPAYRGLYGIAADFEIESIRDTEPGSLMIIHTHVIARARK